MAQSDGGLSFQGLGADGSYMLTVNQNYLAGTEITQVQCTGGPNPAINITYNILNSGDLGAEYFEIHANSGAILLQNDAQSFPTEFATYSAIVVCRSLSDTELRDTAWLNVMYALTASPSHYGFCSLLTTVH